MASPIIKAANYFKNENTIAQKDTPMIQVIRKQDQFNTTIFNGNFIVNKPVANGTKLAVEPYSNLFYWSHAMAIDDCEFGLHPHEGFEIMTFILEGNVTHYDTKSRVWTPLETGDFQIIQSNSGIQHKERITKGTRSFQIWFDPNYRETVKKQPSYTDYHSTDFQPNEEYGIKTITYVGATAKSMALTPQLTIKRLFIDANKEYNYPLDPDSSYTFYLLKSSGSLEGYQLNENDAVRIFDSSNLKISYLTQGELFFIQTPKKPAYQVIWN